MSSEQSNELSDEPTSAAAELWNELSRLMRLLREKSDVALRTVERATGWGRGSLSQIENGKSKPTRAQVEWYDTEFDGDGLLVSLYAEARGAHGPAGRAGAASYVPGDALAVLEHHTAFGQLVPTGTSVLVGWTLRNAGAVAWSGRRLRRVGPQAGRDLLSGPTRIAVPDCRCGEQVDVRFEVLVPDVAATLMAAWEVADERGRPCLPAAYLLRVVLTGYRDD